MQIIILGMHRSGTSAITRLISMMGAYFGDDDASIGSNTDNPKGFFERKDVVACNDALLEAWGCSWENVVRAESVARDVPPACDAQIKTILAEMNAHRPWVMKDPRLCITMPEWKNYLDKSLCVIMYRDPLEVARSLQLRNGFSLNHGLALWEAYTVSELNAARGLPTIFMNHAEVLADPVAAIKKLYDALLSYHVEGLSLPSDEEILAFIEPKLHRSKTALPMAEMLNEKQLQLIPYARGEKESNVLHTVSEGAKEAMGYYAKINEELIKLTDYKDHLFRESQELQKLLAGADEVRRKEREVLYKERDALLEHISTVGANNLRLVDIHTRLETQLDRCLDLADSVSWRMGSSAVKVLNALRFRFKHVDVLSEIKAEVRGVKKADGTPHSKR